MWGLPLVTLSGLAAAAAEGVAASQTAEVPSNKDYTFFSIGDWGGMELDDESPHVTAVAGAMMDLAATKDPLFVARARADEHSVNTGDNFYWCGIQNTSDFQVEKDWVGPFTGGTLANLTWYNSLGNHEYAYNVDAQIQLADLYPTWVMDDRYYTRRVPIGDSGSFITFIVLDTTPCDSEFRGDDADEWDPCSTEYPTCSVDEGDDDFEGACNFHQNVIAQSCTEQFDWFQDQLEAVDADDWLIIVGHNPADEIDVEDFTSAFQAHGFDLYLNGHVHTLTQYTIDGGGAYVTTGAGAMVATPNQEKAHISAKAEGVERLTTANHTYETVFNNKVAGFTLHTFSSDLTKLTTAFYDSDLNLLHSFQTAKQTWTKRARD